MITEINAIKNEKDRELYVQLRNILDNFVIYQIKLHDNKDHLFNECEILEFYELLKEKFPKQLKQECKESQLSEIEVLEYWINENENNMIMYMTSLILLREEYNKRKQ